MAERKRTGTKRSGHKYVTSFVDKYGKRRYRFQKRGHKSIYLPDPSDPKFLDAYTDALETIKPRKRSRPQDTLDAAIDRYIDSRRFSELGDLSKKNYRRRLGVIGRKYGQYSIKTLERKHLLAILEQIDSPSERNRTLSLFKIVLDCALDHDIIKWNVAATIPRARHKEKGYPTWTRKEIEIFLERYGPGTMQRRALLGLYYTGQRGSDIVKMSMENVSGGRISLTQKKTGADIDIPAHPDLLAELPESGLWITTKRGTEFGPDSFRNWFRKHARAAGINKSPHGLRKALATHLAEGGATPSEIAAVTGHKTLSEVARYTRAANKSRLADSAFGKLD